MILTNKERPERPAFADEQKPVIVVGENKILLHYDNIVSDGEKFPIALNLVFSESRGGLSVVSSVINQSNLTVTELAVMPIAGFRSLSGEPEKDAIMWPRAEGQLIPNPANADLSVYAGFRKYERHDQLHTDLDLRYPGGGSMQWYDIFNQNEGIYCASEDTTGQIVVLHVERSVDNSLLSIGAIRYPFAEKNENIILPPLVFIPHNGDWHIGSKLYRDWITESGYYTSPDIPEWMKQFNGWLRVILKPHHLELNWDYSKIPELFDEAKAAGLDTIFLLGWEKGGFARMWPDFVTDEGSLGGEQVLKDGIDYVHSHGGHVAMFLSYYLIDTESEFYKNGGDKAAIVNLWGKMCPFAETYSGDGSWRKLGAPPMPMYAACSGSDMWHEKMKDAAKVCLDLGADAVLYDIGGTAPFFCFSKEHDHKKPSFSHASKASRYADLRQYVKSFGEDKAIYMEHNVDIFGQSMDLGHSSFTRPRNNSCKPEMYRYTFPELNMTNREMGQDDSHYLDNVNYTFIYNMAFDMTIYRCCGSLRDVPKYAAYMKKIIDIRNDNAPFLHGGRFNDNQGFTVSGETDNVIVKSYLAEDGRLGMAVWNAADKVRRFTIQTENASFTVTLEANEVTFIHE